MCSSDLVPGNFWWYSFDVRAKPIIPKIEFERADIDSNLKSWYCAALDLLIVLGELGDVSCVFRRTSLCSRRIILGFGLKKMTLSDVEESAILLVILYLVKTLISGVCWY